MKEKNLLASVALFGQLYNSGKYTDISSIIGEFIKGAVVLHKKYILSSYEVKQLLEDYYNFQIPESVVRTVMFSTLKSFVVFENSLFYFNENVATNYQNIEKELEEKEFITNSIFSSLKTYISEKEERELSQLDDSELFENFNQFLFDNGSSEKYTLHISSFIIKNENDITFVKNLNTIREGLILYQGIKYTADIHQLGMWKTKLVIYLNTEYLFNALGYDGILFKDIFFDFYNLVQEINSANTKNKISLKYFSETKDEIESYFFSAESIVKGNKILKLGKTAMKTIVESCCSPSEVISKKVEFYTELDRLGIELQEFDFVANDYSDYNVEDENVIKELKEIAKNKKKHFDEESCNNFFRMFTKVNFFRKGNSKKSFENAGHIFITNSGFAKYLGHNNSVKFEETDISFAKDLDFATTRFWIKLKKGFSTKTEFPKSFNILNKAKIIISAQINSSISKEFDKLVQETKDGKLTQEVALQRSYALREKPNLPREVTENNIESTFEFLNNENYLDNILREKERKDDLIRETQAENERLKQELKRRDEIEKAREEKIRIKLVAEEEEKQKQKFQKEMGIYIESNWKIVRNQYVNNMFITMGVFIFTFLLALSALILKINSTSSDWLNSLGNYQYLIWTGYAIIIALEVMGRGYLFNKKRITDGWKFLSSFYKYRDFREQQKEILKSAYIEGNQ
jgi:hypothetical protein